MKTKIVYVVITSVDDNYLEELFLSVYTLRTHNSNAYVEVLTDEDSAKSFIGERKELLKSVDYINIQKVPEKFTKMQRSRYLKTNVRKLTSGDFLMLDSDTLIADDISGIDDIDCKIGAVLDYYGKPYENERREWDINNLNIMGWQELSASPRYNSGVFLVRDIPEAYKFYEKWHSYWLQCKDKGINIDQLSLRKAVNDMPIITQIDSKWHVHPNNRYGVFDINLILNGHIFHYFDLPYIPYVRSSEVLSMIKKTAKIPQESLAIINNNLRTVIVCATYRNIEGKGPGFDLISADSNIARIVKKGGKYYHFLEWFSRLVIKFSNTYSKLKQLLIH